MELFYDAKAVRFRSHLNKYLVADDDQRTIRQSRNGLSRNARWLVEVADPENRHLIRLRSSSGMYLTASDEPFLLSMKGEKKILQTSPENMEDVRIVWEPLRYGFQVKLRGYGGKFLSASGGTLRWSNRVTHDSPYSATTHNWILWSVEPVDVPEDESLTDYLTMVSNFSSVSNELSTLDLGSPMSMHSSLSFSPKSPLTRRPAMELFQKAKAVRLQSHHFKYLTAMEDGESVTQDRNGASQNAKWTVEFVEKTDNVIRLKSYYGKYLTASNQSSLLGMTGRKVMQTLPNRLDSSVEWEPIREGNQVKLRTRYGQFLRANGGILPWKNTVTHDIPYQTATQDWVLWDVHVVQVLADSSVPKRPSPLGLPSDSCASETSSSSVVVSSESSSFSTQESRDFFASSPPKLGDGRFIFYYIADELGEIYEEMEELCITFDGNTVEELTKTLEDATGLEEIIVCTKSPLNGKLYPLSLQLPPNNTTMNVIVLPSSSKAITPDSLSDHMSSIPELNGSNFSEWKEQLQITLGRLDLDLCFKIDEPLEESVDYATWEHSNRASLMIMKCKIAKNIDKSIPKSTRAREFLASIERQFMASDKPLIGTLMEMFTTKKYNGTSGVREHIVEMVNMAEQLKSMDMTISESFLVQFVLNSLPSQFGPFKISYNTNKEKWTMDELIVMCVQEEERLKREGLLSVHLVSQIQKGKGPKKGKQKGKKSPNHGNNVTTHDGVSKGNLKCFFCKKKGHLKKDCPERKN
ncbi:uncharacterized protein LOC132067172 [Lycium ferocissimum]|uniref:uncharacterized protein LOC132067172 n=1 Tax=Lycium ferocissimum TaxID=112874 RepID=UPI00281610B5|nr:uncharacterized protein LOC132067172 [Lycium ferocissimum]XP_059316305.1 uncharacterized protein LOC132067172 [Lycium ferocissimum]